MSNPLQLLILLMMKLLDRNEIIGAKFNELQQKVFNAFSKNEQARKWNLDNWTKKNLGSGLSAVIDGGVFFNKAGINYSKISGKSLPSSSVGVQGQYEHNPYFASGLSVVFHPENPFIPTAHLNVRYFCVFQDEKILSEWFGGGFDLTPYFPFEEDCILWHTRAKAACDSADKNFYQTFKRNCDEYFFLPHRKEHRGVGGIFYEQLKFDDYSDGLEFSEQVTNAFIEAYGDIVLKRKNEKFSQRDKEFQKFRRGRYVEFNLLHDRGTLFGLQSGGRIESILMSLPNDVSWRYNFEEQLTDKEKKIYEYVSCTREWC